MTLTHRQIYLWALFAILLIAGAVVAMGVLLDRQTSELKEENKRLLCVSLAQQRALALIQLDVMPGVRLVATNDGFDVLGTSFDDPLPPLRALCGDEALEILLSEKEENG